MKVKDIMTAKVFTCSPDTEIIALAQMMAFQGISGIPVLSDGKLIGIVSEGDLMQGRTGGRVHKSTWAARTRCHELQGFNN
jgi:predicted transcriptional regulator